MSGLPGISPAVTRANKLADKLGIQNRADLQALHHLVENGGEAPAQFLKSSAAKLSKIQNKLGENEAVEYALASSSSGDRTDAAVKALKIKKSVTHRRISVSQELLDDTAPEGDADVPAADEDPAAAAVGLHESNSTTGMRSLSSREIRDGGSGSSEETYATPRKPSQPQPQSQPAQGRDDLDIEELRERRATTASHDKRVRTGKLANFFGAEEDNVGALRRIVDKSDKGRSMSDKRQAVPTFLLRIHFANATHIIVAMPVEATARDMTCHVLRKLMIADNEDQYGLFVVNGTDNPAIKDTDRVYDIVRAWNKSEYILFRRRGKSDGIAAPEIEDALDDKLPGSDGTADVSSAGSKQRKVAKLATFFGVSTDNKRIQEDQAEIEELLGMLNDTLAADATDMAESWKRRAIAENMIFKEGWLTVDGPDMAAETTAWVSLDKGTLHVRYCESRESAVSPRDPVLSTQLSNVVAMAPSPGKCTFVLTNSETQQVMYTFLAATVQDRDDWIQTVNNVAEAKAASGSNGGLSAGEIKRSSSSRMRSRSQRATIDDFEFHRVLGKGKYGKVLLCSHKVSKKVFAIKVIQKDPESADTARTESEILRSIKHPFIVGLHFAFQNPERLYLVMEYVNGGELFFHLSQSGRFPEKRAKFYAAEILLALQCLHGKGIVYRDLKLENILLDKEGHIKIADFGLSRISTKGEGERTFSMAGTLEYFAPEVIEGINYSFPADWWAFGVILFELLCGYHPFYNPNPDILYQLILRAPLEFPTFIGVRAAEVITRLLDRDYRKRLGSGKNGSREIQQHAFFKDVDWVKLFRKEVPPPWRPDLADDFDTSFFDKEFTSEQIEEDDLRGASGAVPGFDD
ncbi:RAC-alpha serine/threonine-protein kinase [Allomyces javanicus]|nr:RAC-alpha serine/threonine-protein kinase [Allomyces javanicus]